MRITIVGALLLGMSFTSGAQTNIYEANGNVGIGTASPAAKLNINTLASDSMSSSLKLGIANDAGNYGVPVGGVTGAYNIDFATWRDMAPDQVGARIRAERINAHLPNAAYVQSMDLAFYTSDGWGSGRLSEKLRIKHNGYIGIGTIAPDEKLTVNGKVHAKEIKVNNNIWPDYVFKSSYPLMPLHKVEAFIKTNGHLPEVPSAKEVEEKGIELGANQALLLKKIEELTLHLIQLEKKVAQQNEQIQQQQQLLSQYLRPGKPKTMK